MVANSTTANGGNNVATGVGAGAGQQSKKVNQNLKINKSASKHSSN